MKIIILWTYNLKIITFKIREIRQNQFKLIQIGSKFSLNRGQLARFGLNLRLLKIIDLKLSA